MTRYIAAIFFCLFVSGVAWAGGNSGPNGGTTFANPTATGGPTANNGSASTAMRSDASPPIQKATNAQFGLAEGDAVGVTCVAGVCSTILVVDTSQTAGFSVAAAQMGKLTPVNISGGGTITLPASGAFSTIFAAGQTWCAENIGATADTITNSTGGTMFPTLTTLQPGDTICFASDGAALYVSVSPGTFSGTGPVARTTSPTFTTPALGTPSAINLANGTNLPNGSVNAASTQIISSTGNTFTAPRGYAVCTTTCTITPPVPVAGYEFCVLNDDNVSTVITLGAIGTSARYENTARTAYGTAGTGTFVSGGAVGDKVCLLGRDSTHYLTTSFTGTWTAN